VKEEVKKPLTHKSIPAAVPIALYERMEAIKTRWGVPFNRMVVNALEKHIHTLEKEMAKIAEEAS